MVGKTLAHYEITEQLGSGGMGDVYRARDTKLNREVALKVLPAEFSKDTSRRKRFMREAQAIASLKHPNIVTVYAVEEVDGVDFIAMELVEGDTLADRIRDGGVKFDDFFSYAIALADAVGSAHAQGITHRDLKPANVMFDRDGRLKVLDFGLAKLFTGEASSEDETVIESGDTGVGQIVGTTAYMSPEQAEGKPIDHRSDIFSLGVVLYELATGERPFKGDTQISTISSILKDTPPHISEVRREMPRHVGRIVNRCLEKSPEQRYQSANDVCIELESLRREVDSGELTAELESGVATAPHPDSASQAVGAPRRKAPPAPLLAGLAIVVAVLVAWALWPTGDGGDDGSVGVASSGDGGSRAVETSVAPTAADNQRKMAVVLPFDNLGAETDAYFAAGMTDELTSRLSAVRDLGVISRTSARQYDRAGKTMKKIGEDLGVDYVVEGSVRFAQTDGAARVRITSLLIRASDDTQLWSETYDRTIDDVFTVQTEIANKVVQSLGVTLGAEEHEMVASVPTENMEAYEAYIRAKDYIDPSGDPVREDAEIVRLLERAVELDPEFYEAWAQLSCHHSEVYNSPFDKTESRIDAARDALRKAEALDPDHPRTHLARGEYLYYGFRNYEEALEEFLAATRKAPNNADAWALVGYIYRRQGKWQQHIETLKKSLELDPQNENTAANLAGSFQALREFETAREYFDLAIELAPEAPFYRLDKALLIASATGDREAAMAVLEAAPPSMPRTFATGILNARFRRFDEARANLAALPEVGPTLTAWQDMLRASMTYTEKGRDAAMDELRTSEAALREILATAPSNTEVRSALALVLAMQGRGEEAVGEARLAADLEQKDRFQGPDRLEALAAVYAQTGRHQEAIDLLEELLETNYSGAITRYDLEQEAVWDPLRDRPRFKALVPPSS